jgi:hypothetical protein
VQKKLGVMMIEEISLRGENVLWLGVMMIEEISLRGENVLWKTKYHNSVLS